MSGDERVHHIMIFGETYSLRSTDPPDYVQRVGQYVDAKFYDIAKGSPTLPAAKMGILASLNIADELFRQEAGRREDDAAAAAKLTELLALLEEGLAGRPTGRREGGLGAGLAGSAPP